MDTAYMVTPLGILLLEATNNGVSRISFTDLKNKPEEEVPSNLTDCIMQLGEYFQRKRKEFDLKLDPKGTTFQKKVWRELQEVPFGTTRSYLQQARLYGDEKAIRAIASANGKNPLAIVVPCHRIVGSDGSLTGYAGGLWRKKWLLEHEDPPSQTSLFS